MSNYNHDDSNIQVEDRSLDHFIIISHKLLSLPLTTEAFRVYAQLKKYAGANGQCYPSYSRLAKECFRGSFPEGGESTLRKKAISSVQELINWGIVEKEHRPYGDTESSATNLYILTPTSSWRSAPLGESTLKHKKSNKAKKPESTIPGSLSELGGSLGEPGHLNKEGSSLGELGGSLGEPGGSSRVNPKYIQGNITNEKDSLIKTPYIPQTGKRDGEEQAPFTKLVTTESNPDTHTTGNNPTQEERKCAGVVRQTGTIEQPNNYDARFMNNRRQNRLTGNYMSNQFDEWMETANRPDKAFTQWLYQKRYEKQGKLVADAVSEILNNYERAELLWEEYKQEQEKRAQHQNLLKENGMAPAKSETTPTSSLPTNYKETATAPEIKPLKQSQIPHLRFGKGVSTNIPSWQKYANRKIEDLE
jgi:Helix-turn-helix domain